MKRIIYIISFTILGILLGLLLHSVIEIAVIKLLLRDYDKYGLGLEFGTWFKIHTAWSIITFIGGATLGFLQGRKWWRVLYVEQRYRKWLKKPLKLNF